MTSPLFYAYEATFQSLRSEKFSLYNYVYQNMSACVILDNMLMLSFVSASMHVCLHCACCPCSHPNLYSAQVG